MSVVCTLCKLGQHCQTLTLILVLYNMHMKESTKLKPKPAPTLIRSVPAGVVSILVYVIVIRSICV